jgi:hypothetical protein
MAYIKISDPKIIDLPTIHQIINVVNQHSDNISALTNNFGSVLSGATTTGATTEYQYDMSSQQILYGITKFTSAAATWNSSDNTYTINASFVLPFGATPIVTATIALSPTTSADFQDLIVRTYPDSQRPTAAFNIVLKHAAKTYTTNWLATHPTGSINVNWIAIGHK